MLEYGFKGVIRQFMMAKMIARDSDLSFLDLLGVWDILPVIVRSYARARAGPSQIHAETLQPRAHVVSSSSSAEEKGKTKYRARYLFVPLSICFVIFTLVNVLEIESFVYSYCLISYILTGWN